MPESQVKKLTMGYIRQKLSVTLHRSRSILKRDVDTEVERANFVGRGNLNEEWRISIPAAVPAATIPVHYSEEWKCTARQSSSYINVGNLAVIKDKGKEKEDGAIQWELAVVLL